MKNILHFSKSETFGRISEKLFFSLQYGPGLPDGIFSNQNLTRGKFWWALDRKILMYFLAIWNILRTLEIIYDNFFIFCVYLVHFFRFWYHAPRKIWQP
jgi:hypothetical protein